MSASISALQPDLVPFARALIDAAGAARLMPRVTSTLRSHAEQERLYRRFLAGQQPYPVARPGTSAHEYGWAFDLVVSPMSALSEVGAYWESLGGVWGGHPGSGGGRGTSYDPVHFEYPGWRAFVNWNQPDQRGMTDLAGLAETYRGYRARALPYGVGEVAEFFNPYGEAGEFVTELPFVGLEAVGEGLGRLVGGWFR